MRPVDTDIVVRYLTGDDPKRAEAARALIAREPAFVPRTVLREAEWVLRSAYELSSERIIPALRAFAGLPGVAVEDAAMCAKALDRAEAGMDVADALHLAATAACRGFLTFDRRFARAGGRIGGVRIEAP